MNYPKSIYKAKINNRTFIVEDFEDNETAHMHIFEDGVYVKDYQNANYKDCKTQARNQFSVPEIIWKKVRYNNSGINTFYSDII